MLYKRDFYTLIFEKSLPWEGGPTPSPRTSDKCAPFEILPLQNSECSGAPVQEE